jgi:superfamily II DNA or RNA helicase
MSNKRWLKIEKHNNISARVTTNHPSIFGELYNYLSVYVENYRFMPKYKMGMWDGKIYFMQKNGIFPIGLMKYVYKYVKQDGLEIIVDPELTERFEADDFAEVTETWMGKNEDGEQWVPYQHQVEGALRALKYNRCIIEHATSAGKSLTMSLIIMYKLLKEQNKKVLVLVPSTGLVKQLTNDFIEYGVPPEWIGNFYGAQKDTEEQIIISTWQSMCKQRDFVKEFDMIICDEVHNLRGDTVRSVAENAINATTRIGCTGTLPDPKVDKMRIEGALGPVVHRVTAKDLIDAGHASDILIKIAYIFHSQETKKLAKGLPYDEERKFLEEYEPRNKVLRFIVNKHHEVDHNCLVLVDHIAHAENLVEMMETMGDDRHIFLVTGETHPDKREEIRQFVNKNKKCVIVATYGVFSTGISIKRLHAVIFGSAGKSKIRTLQSIGRGLRLHKEKNRLTLYDIGDDLTYADKHLQKRIDIYTRSQFDIAVDEIYLEKD